MDPVSGAASLIALGTLATNVATTLFQICRDVKGARREIEEVGNTVSLLGTVLFELEETLNQNEWHHPRRLDRTVFEVINRCQQILHAIKGISGLENGAPQRATMRVRLMWCIKKDRVKLLQASLESLKSTLSVLMNVVLLSKLMPKNTAQEIDENEPRMRTQAAVERKVLIALLIDNHVKVDKLEQLELDEEAALTEPMDHADTQSGPAAPEREIEFARVAAQGIHDAEEPLKEGLPHRRQESQSNDDARELPLPFSLSDDDDIYEQAVDLKDFPLFRPRTSQIVLDAIPQRRAGADLVIESPSKEESAEKVIETLVDDLTIQRSLPIPYYIPVLYDGEAASARPKPMRRKRRASKTNKAIEDKVESKKGDSDSISEHNRSTSRRSEARVIPREETIISDDRTPNPPRSPSPLKPHRRRNKSKKADVRREGGKAEDGTDSSEIDTNSENKGGTSSSSSDSSWSRFLRRRIRQSRLDYLTEANPKVRELQEKYNTLSQQQALNAAKQEAREETLSLIRAEQKIQHQSSPASEVNNQAKLKDFLGRTFLLPIEACRSWQALEALIKSSFVHLDPVRLQIEQGNYELISPTGEIIMPQVYEAVMQPGWVVELRLRRQANALGESLVSPGTQEQSSGLAAAKATPTAHTNSNADSSESRKSRRSRLSIRSWLGGRRGASKGSPVADTN